MPSLPSFWRQNNKVSHFSISTGKVRKGEELLGMKEDPVSDYLRDLTYRLNVTGLTQACWELSDVQIQKNSWTVDRKLLGRIQGEYNSCLCVHQRVGKGVSQTYLCLKLFHFCFKGLGSDTPIFQRHRFLVSGLERWAPRLVLPYLMEHSPAALWA